MSSGKRISGWKDKILFTPGPLTTSRTVKQAMLKDVGSRDFEFIETIADIRSRLLDLAAVEKGDFESIIMQGSGTFGIEAVIGSSVPPEGKLLILSNGAYGKRMEQIADILQIDTTVLNYDENEQPDIDELKDALDEDDEITNVAVVHCETTTGILNPIKEIGEVVADAGKIYFVDAMSSFGAVPIDMAENNIDYLVSSSNKCIEGVPGFSFIIAANDKLIESEHYTRSLSLDLYRQWQGLEKNGQFRFTPPTHALMAFHQALLELDDEGGVEGRAKRYSENYDTLIQGMDAIGFEPYLPSELRSYIITSFLYPDHPNFDFHDFYTILNQKDQVIYPGKLSDVDCFRIGNIGRIFTPDILTLLAAIEETLFEMDVDFD